MLKKHRAIFGIFIFSLIIRLVFIFALGTDEKFYDSLYDQTIYVDMAESIMAGRGFSTSYDIFVADAFTPTAIQPPVYPVFLATIFWIFGEKYLVIRLIQVVLGSLMCVIGFAIGKKVADRSVGLVAALIIAVYPLFVMYTRPIITDLLYTLGISLIVLLFAYFVSGTFKLIHFIIWGLVVGITFLIRPEALLFAPLFVPFVFFWALKSNPSGKQFSIWKTMGYCALAGLMFLITVAPWGIRNWQVFGKPIIFPSKNWGWWELNWLKYNIETSSEWYKNCKGDYLRCTNPDFENLSELERDSYAGKLGKEFIIQHPLIFARYGLSRLHVSFPIIPRESLPPPIGYKGVSERPDDGLDATSLDDFPLYLNPVEKLRVWSLRILLLLAAIGLVFTIKQRNWFAAIVFALPVCLHICSAFLLHGGERMRMSIDICLILLASYAVVTIYLKLPSALYKKY